MTSLSFKKFKIIFICIQKNIKSAAIFSAKFSHCSIVMSGENSHDTASKHYWEGGVYLFCEGILHNFTMQNFAMSLGTRRIRSIDRVSDSADFPVVGFTGVAT